MAILAAMQSAAITLIGRKPVGFFGSTEKFEIEIADLINEVAEDVARYQDWEGLQAIASLAGDGTATALDLPADYSRMLKNSDVRSSVYRLWGFTRYDNINDFLQDQVSGFRAAPGGWIITGGQIKFNPAPTGDASFPYISSAWAKAEDGVRKSQFDADTDTFLLPERLLKLGLIWRWRDNKKLDASGDQEAFTKALDEYAVSDGGSRVYRYNGRRSFPGTHLAWPGLLGGGSSTLQPEQWDDTQW
jgi:hypothetical protein